MLLCNRAAAALMMGDDIHKFSRSPRLERSEFAMMNGGAGMVNPASRQIYLTFPADSTFREEDVSNYFRYLLMIFLPYSDYDGLSGRICGFCFADCVW